MSGIASVASHKFITRMFAATALLQTFYPLNLIGLTGAFALIGASSSVAAPFNFQPRYRGVGGQYSRGRPTLGGGPMSGLSGLNIGPSGGISIGPSRGMSIEPSSGARPSRVSSGQSGSVRAIRSTGGSRLTAEQVKPGKVSPKNAVRAPSRQSPILAGTQNPSVPNADGARGSGSQSRFDRQGPVSQGGGSVFQESPIRDNAVFRDGGGAVSSRQSTGAGRDNSTASQDSKSVPRDKATSSRDGAAASRDKASASQDGKAASRDNATASSDGTGASRDGAVASRDGASGGTLKADDIRRAMDRCAQTYVSYDRTTMTYLDHNGDKQSCP